MTLEGYAQRAGWEDIRAAGENVSSPLRGERFVDVLERSFEALAKLETPRLSTQYQPCGTSICNDRAMPPESYSAVGFRLALMLNIYISGINLTSSNAST
jgi:hypothetical protein